MITKEMAIGEVVQKFPQTVPVFQAHGMGCLGCAIASFENIEQGASAHGIDPNKLIQALNDALKS